MAVHLSPIVNVQLFILIFFIFLLQVCGWHKCEVVAGSFAFSPFLPSVSFFPVAKKTSILSEAAEVQPSIKLGFGLPKKKEKKNKNTKQKGSRMHLCLMCGDSPLGASAQFVTGLTSPADCQRRRTSPR